MGAGINPAPIFMFNSVLSFKLPSVFMAINGMFPIGKIGKMCKKASTCGTTTRHLKNYLLL